ncbi:HU family DNA-binding protein [Kingella kingae]|uniref:HU family DNA-binding protein n=1 Tax=Kingella kingae TaxID=504 RepID=UPI0025547536|nr:HU family DNA-binding protein [Kingella kingae]MDK4640517.1 HU family DNA-binding protein [Kingella kingae]
MNKSELIAAMAVQSGLNKTQTETALNAFCATVIDELAKGGEVNIVGFGAFSVAERAERIGRNPKTGEALIIAAHRSPKFKAGKALKDATA